MNFKLTAGWLYGALVVLLCAWILHEFLQPLLAAGVIAIASWPLYERFAARLPRRVTRGAASLMFTCAVTAFMLGPLMFAFLALLSEGRALLRDIAVAGENGVPVPSWLEHVPLGGPWLAAHWESGLARPGALSMWAQRSDPAALLPWVQSLGQFTLRHALIIVFTILLLFLLYREGKSLARELRQLLRHQIGERAEGYLDVGARAVRASVNSLLVLGLFDGIATWIAYAIAGVPHAAVWGAITGALALVPFLGYAAVGAVTLHLAMTGAATAALLSLGLGCAVLFCGDKVVRPVVARQGTHLPFAWVLMGCLGGFEVLGPVGLVIGPVALTVTRELWAQRIRHLARDSALEDPLTLIKATAARNKPHAPHQSDLTVERSS
jgi:predicted PurR-regulated permease PerM